jgi:hypothetical protein
VNNSDTVVSGSQEGCCSGHPKGGCRAFKIGALSSKGEAGRLGTVWVLVRSKLLRHCHFGRLMKLVYVQPQWLPNIRVSREVTTPPQQNFGARKRSLNLFCCCLFPRGRARQERLVSEAAMCTDR